VTIGLSTAKWAEDVVNFDFFTQSLADAVVFFSSRPCATKGTKSSAKTAGKAKQLSIPRLGRSHPVIDA